MAYKNREHALLILEHDIGLYIGKDVRNAVVADMLKQRILQRIDEVLREYGKFILVSENDD